MHKFIILLAALIFSLSCNASFSKDSLLITQKIAQQANANLTHFTGDDATQVQETIQYFTEIAPKVIEEHRQQLKNELKNLESSSISKRSLSNHHFLSIKYAKSARNTIQKKLKDHQYKSLKKHTLSKRQFWEAAAAVTIGDVLGIAGGAAIAVLAFLSLITLVLFFADICNRFFASMSYGFGPFGYGGYGYGGYGGYGGYAPGMPYGGVW